MPKELSMERKNIYRREESQRVRVERIITGYVKYQHPEIFKEANDYYDLLNTLYPDKKDLRRCNEYELLKRETSRRMRKYYTKKPKTADEKSKTADKKSKTADTMVLRIPLMDEATVSTTTQSAEIPAYTHEATVSTTTTTQSAEIPAYTHKVTVETTTQSAEIPAYTHEVTIETTTEELSTPSMTTDLAPVSDEVLNQIIEDLREDPDITNFFDNIDFELDDCPLW